MNNTKEIILTECAKCKKITARKELKHNSKFGGYGFKKICNRCADFIDNEQDNLTQNI